MPSIYYKESHFQSNYVGCYSNQGNYFKNCMPWSNVSLKQGVGISLYAKDYHKRGQNWRGRGAEQIIIFIIVWHSNFPLDNTF